MPKISFTKLVNSKIKDKAFKYLLNTRGSKGVKIQYSALEMAEYLLPFNDKMRIDNKQRIFSVKNRMVDILEK
jgi:hypothetical protein